MEGSSRCRQPGSLNIARQCQIPDEKQSNTEAVCQAATIWIKQLDFPTECPGLFCFLLVTWHLLTIYKATLRILFCQVSDISWIPCSNDSPWAVLHLYLHWPTTACRYLSKTALWLSSCIPSDTSFTFDLFWLLSSWCLHPFCNVFDKNTYCVAKSGHLVTLSCNVIFNDFW